MLISFFLWTGLINALTSAFLGVLIFFKDRRDKVIQVFALFCLSVALWGTGYFMWLRSSTSTEAIAWIQLFMAAAIFIPSTYLHFVLVFLDGKMSRGKKALIWISYFVAVGFFFIDLFGFNFISGVQTRLNFPFWPVPGLLFHPFLIWWISVVLYSTALLYRGYVHSEGLRRLQIKSILIGMIVGYIGGITNYLLWYNIPIAPWGNILVSFYVIAVAYAVMKYRLLNVKVIATELLTALIIFVLLVQVFASQSTLERLLRVLFLLLVSFFGYLLIKSVGNEVKRREETEILANRLKTSNQQLAERNLFLKALQDITSLITRTLDFQNMTQEIVDGISTRLHYVGGVVLLLSEDLKKIYPIAWSRTSITEKVLSALPVNPLEYYGNFDRDDTLSIRAIKDGQIQVADRLNQFFSPPIPLKVANAMQKVAGIKSVVAVPIFSESGIIGVIDFFLAKPKSEIRMTEFEMMQALANQMGIVTRNLMFYDQIRAANDQLQIANEKLMELDKLKSEFISIASHQLRTPLTIIKGYLSLIMEGSYGPYSQPIGQTLQNIFESSQRLIALVNDLLDISRIESGRMIFDLQVIDLNQLVRTVVDELKLNAEKKDLKFSYEAPAVPVMVNADASKLRQVVFNLVDNSIKYTHKGFVKVGLHLKDNEATFDVTDSGVGVPPEVMGRLFEKFSRGSQALTNSEGTGLGLFIAKKIIEALGGKIGAESDGAEKGSRFFFTIKTTLDG